MKIKDKEITRAAMFLTAILPRIFETQLIFILLELKPQVPIAEPRYAGDNIIQVCRFNDRVVNPVGKANRNEITMDNNVCPHSDEMSKYRRGSAVFKTPEFLGREMIEGMADHGHQDVEMCLNQNREGKSVKTEELDGFSDAVFNLPSPGKPQGEGLWGIVEIDRDHKRELLPASIFHNNLSQGIGIADALTVD